MGLISRLRNFASRMFCSVLHDRRRRDYTRDRRYIRFHPKRGKELHRSNDGTIVYKKKRLIWRKSKNAMTFSERPIASNEIMTIDLTNVAAIVGLVFQNPESLRQIQSAFGIFDEGKGLGIVLPKSRSCSVQFVYTDKGDVCYNLDGEDVAMFFSVLQTQTKPWILIDMYNNNRRMAAMDKDDHIISKDAICRPDRGCERAICDICCDRVADAVLGECGHSSCCYECAERWLRLRSADKPCPYCRGKVQYVVKDTNFIKTILTPLKRTTSRL